ncbi:hypothetical protein SAMN05421856_1172 [Chryseobacterium taichungense]|uniref:Uncharacterized protein n=2 Tax=Chryseobacterium TaxID=59732 RepID=A0A1H8DUF2_9FLAO|nr:MULTISPECIES: hypothetical protein [Chryseobacterium]SEN10919.1 hypothetical protein SAMN05421856_1172 [Chryseobacterium taichungense]STA63136.1 Uncharacterised protein [Chryseobacterium indoltheticum]
MGKPTKLGDFAKNLTKEKRTPLQMVVPVKDKPLTKKFLMNLPVETYEFLRKKAFEENTDMKTLILSAINEIYYKS